MKIHKILCDSKFRAYALIRQCLLQFLMINNNNNNNNNTKTCRSNNIILILRFIIVVNTSLIRKKFVAFCNMSSSFVIK